MIRKVVKLAIFLLVANAVYQIATPSWNYYKFKDAVHELALFSQKLTDAQLVEQIMRLAEENHVPLVQESVSIRHTGDVLFVDAPYSEAFKLFPGYDYNHEFAVSSRTVQIRGDTPR